MSQLRLVGTILPTAGKCQAFADRNVSTVSENPRLVITRMYPHPERKEPLLRHPPYRPPVGPSGWQDAGKELIARVKRQPLTQFLDSQRWKERGKKNTNILGIPPIDALINKILNPVLPNPENFPKRLRLPVIEISSRGSLGKTQLLYYICAVSTLPTWLKGKDSAVVIIDCPCKFDVKRLYVVMKGYAKKHQALTTQKSLTDRQLHKVILGALTHVHIFQPKDSGQLLATIKNIKPYLYGETEHKHYSAQKKVDCIMIDGISRFIWEDRFHDYGAVMVDEDHPNWINLWSRYEEITNELRAVATTLCCFIVVTNIGFNIRYNPDKTPVLCVFGEKRTQYRPAKVTAWHRYYEPWKLDLPIRPPSFLRPYLTHVLPQPWTPFVNVKLVLQRAKENIPQFPKGTSMLLAMRNREAHVAAVRDSGIVGFADTIGLGGGLQNSVQVVNNGTGNFHLYINKDGVDVTI